MALPGSGFDDADDGTIDGEEQLTLADAAEMGLQKVCFVGVPCQITPVRKIQQADTAFLQTPRKKEQHVARQRKFLKGYGEKSKYNGVIHAFDMETGKVGKLTPRGTAGAEAIPYLCQIRYDVENDLLLVGATLPPDNSGFRRTPAYDCAGDRWVSLKIGGTDPSGKAGRNVSLGLMYDARRKQFWAVDTKSKVYALRLDPRTADLRPLE